MNIEQKSLDIGGFWEWVKAHKKQLALAGISLGVIVLVVLGLKNKDSLYQYWRTLQNAVQKKPSVASTDSPSIPDMVCAPSVEIKESVTRSYRLCTENIHVKWHIRNMGEGRHHSIQKAEEARALGIDLLPNQTIVCEYIKNAA